MKKRAYHKVLQEHKDRIYSYAFYFLRNREDAEDVTQEVFIKVWQHWDKIEKQRIAAWLTRVTHNQCVDMTRRKKTGNQHRVIAGDFDLSRVSDKDSTQSNPESSLEFSEMQATLLEAMKALPEKTQSMLLMHYFQGLKYETIGEILDTKISAVKVAIHRGRKSLKKILAENFPERVGTRENECAMS